MVGEGITEGGGKVGGRWGESGVVFAVFWKINRIISY
jgi:hypothetical protein